MIEENVQPAALHRVRNVKIRIGEMAGVSADSLAFSFSALTERSDLQQAALRIEHVPFAVRCRHCTAAFSDSNGRVVCPFCGGIEADVLGGTELEVVEIELDENLSSHEYRYDRAENS